MDKILLVMSDHSPLLSLWWWGKKVGSYDLQYLFILLFLGHINDDTFIFSLQGVLIGLNPSEFSPLLTGFMR